MSYTFDQMGRLNTMTDNIANQQIIQGATYGPANELLSLTGGSAGYAGQTRTYNSLKQLTGITGVRSYSYPSTGNNGKISSETDPVSGETVTYTYDALNRLATAEDNSNFSQPWGQSFTYDGFGNLTQTNVIQGSAPTMTASYDVNNHQGGEDANGNPGNIPAPAFGTSVPATYDVENRLIAANMNYSYDPANHRVWRGTVSGGTTDEITFWSVSGRKLGTYQITYQTIEYGPTTMYCTQTGTNYYFGSMLIKDNNGWVYPDRLGSIGKFYPYGAERPSATTNGTEKFTGYFRDSETGNDYAVNRYESPGTGRFLTPDPLPSSANASDPGSWNRYAYVGGDPANRVDPTGLCDPFDPNCVGGSGSSSPLDPGSVSVDTCENLLEAAEGGDPVATALFGVYCNGFPWAGGGSGGGSAGAGGGSMPFAPRGSLSTPQLGNGVPKAIQQIFDAAFGAAFRDLFDPQCDSVYGSALGTLPITTAQLWATLTSATYEWSACLIGTAINPKAAGCTDAETQTVTINFGGVFGTPGFNSSSTATYPVGTNGTTLPGVQAMTFLLLHELGHLEGVDADANNYNNPFNVGVLTDCMGVKVK